MPRAGLDAEAVVTAAARLADAEGLECLTLARLAQRLGVRSPSLYAHVDGLEDLRARLATRGAGELGAALQAAAAGRAGADALRAVADAYRAYAEAHPGSYAALQRPASGSAAYEAAATMAVDTMLAVVAGYGLEGDEAIHAVRGVRAALHGFVTLEREAGFAISLPTRTSYERLVAMLDRALASTP